MSQSPAEIPTPPQEVLDLQGHAYGTVSVLVAMDEEAQPFLDSCEHLTEGIDFGNARYWALRHQGQNLLLVRTGIGLVNAASASTTAIALTSPRAIISAGSAGGLRGDVEVGDLAIGASYAYADADATVFGYPRGQVPGMPERYEAGAEPLDAAQKISVEALSTKQGAVHVGLMLAGGSFVTSTNVADTREAFPDAISTDMETTAIAQVAQTFGVDALSIRGISDLCGPRADQQFHMEVDVVARRSADMVLAVIGRITAETSQ